MLLPYSSVSLEYIYRSILELHRCTTYSQGGIKIQDVRSNETFKGTVVLTVGFIGALCRCVEKTIRMPLA